MSDQRPGFISRIFLSWVAYFRTLFDADFAAGVVRLRSGGALPADAGASSTEDPKKEEKKDTPPPKAVVLREATPDAALQLLSLLQREGRFIDFLEEDVASFSDAEIGAAARVVHEGCKKALDEHLTIEAVRSEEEGAKVTLEAGFDAGAVRLTGNVVGEAPFTGTLSHRGWRATKIELPKLAEDHDAKVLMAAEVEL